MTRSLSRPGLIRHPSQTHGVTRFFLPACLKVPNLKDFPVFLTRIAVPPQLLGDSKPLPSFDKTEALDTKEGSI